MKAKMTSKIELLALAALIGAGSYRLWRLLAHDRVLNFARARIPVDGKMEYFVGCPWCMGMYLNLAAVAGYIIYTGSAILDGLLIIGAATVVTGFLGDRL